MILVSASLLQALQASWVQLPWMVRWIHHIWLPQGTELTDLVPLQGARITKNANPAKCQPSDASDLLSLGPPQSTLGGGKETPVKTTVKIAVGGLTKSQKEPEEGEGQLSALGRF